MNTLATIRNPWGPELAATTGTTDPRGGGDVGALPPLQQQPYVAGSLNSGDLQQSSSVCGTPRGEGEEGHGGGGGGDADFAAQEGQPYGVDARAAAFWRSGVEGSILVWVMALLVLALATNISVGGEPRGTLSPPPVPCGRCWRGAGGAAFSKLHIPSSNDLVPPPAACLHVAVLSARTQ